MGSMKLKYKLSQCSTPENLAVTSQRRDDILGEPALPSMLKPILCPYLSKSHTDTFFPHKYRYVRACLEKIFHILGLQEETLPLLRPGSHEPIHGNCLCPWLLHSFVADPNLVTLVWVICFRLTCLTADQPDLELRIHSLYRFKGYGYLLCSLRFIQHN